MRTARDPGNLGANCVERTGRTHHVRLGRRYGGFGKGPLAALAAVCLAALVFLNPGTGLKAAGEGERTDPRPTGAEILTWYPPEGQSESAPGFEPYQDSAGTVVRLSRETTIPFVQFAKPLSPDTLHYGYYKRAVRQFPDVQSCLANSEKDRTQPELTKFDWSNFRNSKFAEVCLFRIATSYRSAEDFANWLESQGFKTSSGYVLLYRSDRSYPNSLDFQVHGKWSVRDKGALIYKDQDTRTKIEGYIISYSVTLAIRVGVGILRTSAGYDYP